MATQTQADREEAAQKAAATRRRNEIREKSQETGRKAAATRHRNDAIKALKGARKDVGKAASTVGSAARSTRDAGVSTAKAVASRVGIGSSG